MPPAEIRRSHSAIAVIVVLILAAVLSSCGKKSNAGSTGSNTSAAKVNGSASPWRTSTADPSESNKGATTTAPSSAKSPPTSQGTRAGGSKGGANQQPNAPIRCGIRVAPAPPNGKRPQQVVFPPPGTDHEWPNTKFPLRACATSGLLVTYELVGQNTNCTLSASGSKTYIIAKTVSASCTVAARQDGDSNWAPAPGQERPFRVGTLKVKLEWADAGAKLGTKTTLQVRVISSSAFHGPTITAFSSPPCSVSTDRNYKGGSIPVTVSTTATSGTCDVTVRLNGQSITANKLTGPFKIGQ
jgi:hypothetical protein